MKLSLCITAPEDSGAEDSDSNTAIPDHPEIEHIEQVLQDYLAELYPASKLYETVEVSLSFMTPEGIRELNKEYRGVDEPTDVLSFPLLDDEPVGVPLLSLGDIVICQEETHRLHPELGLQDAMCLMIAHSFLHLLGYDHDSEEAQAKMWSLQDEIAAKMQRRDS